jgi:Kef-type K+ transport system membrane component KefB
MMGIMGFLLVALAISNQLHISELLTIMIFGCTLVNKNLKLANRTKETIEALNPMFLPWFFILVASELNVGLIKTISGMGIVYIIARTFGKVGFASLGAIVSNAPPTVKKYIGFSLIPQLGVSVALALAVKKQFTKPVYGAAGSHMSILVINVLLLTTIFTEILGPVFTYFSLKKAGDIRS